MEDDKALKKPELLCKWSDIWEYLNQKKTFLFGNQEMFFCLPISANNLLKKAIKNSHKTTSFTIEDENEEEARLKQAKKDWSVISKGIIARKDPIKLKITFTKIHKNNLPYITDTLRKSNISEAIFHDCTFEEECFDSLCDAIGQSTLTLKSVSLTKNNLTDIQIANIKDAVAKQGKHLVLYSSEIRRFSSINQVKEMPTDDYNRYIFTWMDELSLSNLDVEDPRLCYAVKLSSCLQSIIIHQSDNSKYSWRWMKNAIIENKSIHRIKLFTCRQLAKDSIILIDSIIDIFSNTNITEFEIVEAKDQTTIGLASLISFNYSLKHLTLNCFNDENDLIIEAITKHKSITALTLKNAFTTSNKIKALLTRNPKINSLTLIRGSISSNSTIIKAMFVPTLKELHLHNCYMTGELLIRHLTMIIPKCKHLQAFSFTDLEVFQEPFKDIMSHKSIQKIDLTNIKLAPAEAKAILDQLMNHNSITNFAIHLQPKNVQDFAKILRENQILLHIGISFDPTTFDEDDIEQLKRAIQSNTNLRSFKIVTNKYNEIVLDLIADSESITSLELRTVQWSNKSQQKFVKQATNLLAHNKFLSKIVINEMENVIQVDPAIQKLIKRNKDQKICDASNLLYFIGTMAAKSQPYLSLLPLEVWSNIFNKISIPGVVLDFSKILLKKLDNM